MSIKVDKTLATDYDSGYWKEIVGSDLGESALSWKTIDTTVSKKQQQ